MQILPHYCQAILNLSSGLGHRLQKYTHQNYNPRKSPLSVRAARCEVTSTSPTAVLGEFSKYLICSYKRSEAGCHLTAHCLLRTVPQRREAALGPESDVPAPGLLPRAFGSCSPVPSPRGRNLSPVPTSRCWLTLKERHHLFFLRALRSSLCRIKATAEPHCWLGSPVSYFGAFAGAIETHNNCSWEGPLEDIWANPQLPAKTFPSILHQAGEAAYQYPAPASYNLLLREYRSVE